MVLTFPLLLKAMVQAGAIVGKTTDYRNKAVAAGKIWVDTSVQEEPKVAFLLWYAFKPKTLKSQRG